MTVTEHPIRSDYVCMYVYPLGSISGESHIEHIELLYTLGKC